MLVSRGACTGKGRIRERNALKDATILCSFWGSTVPVILFVLGIPPLFYFPSISTQVIPMGRDSLLVVGIGR